jgi:hypothetical protein
MSCRKGVKASRAPGGAELHSIAGSSAPSPRTCPSASCGAGALGRAADSFGLQFAFLEHSGKEVQRHGDHGV